ncbi:hypothetical protein D3C86_1848050 [compost metagenome]
MARAVDERRLRDLLRYRHKKLSDHKNPENRDHAGQNQRPMRVIDAELVEHNELRHEQHLWWNHHHGDVEEEQAVPLLKLYLRKTVSRKSR